MIVALIALVFAMTGTGIAARGLITGKQIKDGSITAKDLANGAVVESKVANGAISQKKLGRAAVAASNLSPGSVTAAALAANAVDSAAIAPNSVLGSDLGPGSVTADALAANSVTGNALADNAVAVRNLKVTLPSGARARSLRAYNPNSGGVVCPNGMVVYPYYPSGQCPAIIGVMASGGDKVVHFAADMGPDGIPSDCTATDARWSKSSGEWLQAVGDGHYFQTNPAYAYGGMNVLAQADWTNVSSTATTFLSFNFGGWRDPDKTANPDPGQLLDGKSYGFLNNPAQIKDGETTTSIAESLLVSPRSFEIFSAGAIACNSTASGLGAPVLSTLRVSGQQTAPPAPTSP